MMGTWQTEKDGSPGLMSYKLIYIYSMLRPAGKYWLIACSFLFFNLKNL